MKFGLSFLPDVIPAEKSSQAYFSEALKLSQFADQAGFYCVKMTEHYLHGYGGYCPNPLTFLASVASCTQNIRLMTGCLLPVFHHPITLAAETAMVDAISGGRLDVGFARAYLPYEFDAFGISMDQSRERFCETIQAVKKLWLEDDVSITTPFFNFTHVNSLPKTVQTPHPPVWCAAVNSRQTFSWAAEQGFNLLVTPPPGPYDKLVDNLELYHECRAETGRGPGMVALSLPILLSKEQSQAEEQANIYLRKYLDVWADAACHWQGRNSSDYPGYAKIAHIIRSNTPEAMIGYRQALVGTADKVIEDIKFIKQTINVDVLLLQIDFGGQPYQCSLETLNIFADSVQKSVNTES